MEPWNLGSRLHILGSMVPWFHPKFQCQKSKILLGGTMEPWNQGSRLHIWGSMVPWFHPNFFRWNHGTMEPRFQATQKRFHGSMVPGWNHGTMEPWNPNVYYVLFFDFQPLLQVLKVHKKVKFIIHHFRLIDIFHSCADLAVLSCQLHVNSRHYVANFQQKGSSVATTLFRPLKVIEPNKGWLLLLSWWHKVKS